MIILKNGVYKGYKIFKVKINENVDFHLENQ